jgi:nucleotide-binding universal stress UspA family protein
MKTILLPMFADAPVDAAIAAARAIAFRFDSHVEGLFVRAAPLMVPRGPVPAHFLEQYSEYWDQSAEDARNRFAAIMNENGIPFREAADETEGPTAWWREMEGEWAQIVGNHARLFELTILARPTGVEQEDWGPVSEAAIFDSGRPILIPGASPIDRLGETIVIAWNRSTETARTIAMTMPMLIAARKVIVLSVEGASGGSVPGPRGEMLAGYLSRAGVMAEALTVQASGRSSGDTVLEEAAALGADLVLKGAYTHNRLRQMIFGGTTRHIITHSALPVLIAH